MKEDTSRIRLSPHEIAQTCNVLKDKVVGAYWVSKTIAQDTELLQMGDHMFNDNTKLGKLLIKVFLFLSQLTAPGCFEGRFNGRTHIGKIAPPLDTLRS